MTSVQGREVRNMSNLSVEPAIPVHSFTYSMAVVKLMPNCDVLELTCEGLQKSTISWGMMGRRRLYIDLYWEYLFTIRHFSGLFVFFDDE
jgi:hypothetical protein